MDAFYCKISFTRFITGSALTSSPADQLLLQASYDIISFQTFLISCNKLTIWSLAPNVPNIIFSKLLCPHEFHCVQFVQYWPNICFHQSWFNLRVAQKYKHTLFHLILTLLYNMKRKMCCVLLPCKLKTTSLALSNQILFFPCVQGCAIYITRDFSNYLESVLYWKSLSLRRPAVCRPV